MSLSLSKQEAAAIKEFKGCLLDRYPANVISLRLYGSKVRGTAHAESDIDLLILVKERTSEFDDYTIDVVCEIINKYGVYIETVTMTGDDYRDALDLQMPFAINLSREAQEL